MVKIKKGMSVKEKVTIGAGLAAVGAGAYYLLGPKGKKNQKKAKVLVAKVEKEIGGKIEKIKSVVKKIS